MKCTNNIKGFIKRTAAVIAVAAVCCTEVAGCGSAPLENVYNVEFGDNLGMPTNTYAKSASMFSDDLCPPLKKDKGLRKVSYSMAEGSGLFNIDTKQTLYGDDINKKLYPASTTKILTAYIALKELDLDKTVTVGQPACIQPPGASLASLSPGDKLTVEDLLYGLLLVSGNDAADVLAAEISGSAKKFKKRMNEELALLGATNTHFCTSNGLHRDNHYTTVYDMHLIMRAAIQNEKFREIINTEQYTARFQNASGSPKVIEYNTTNWFLSGKWSVPSGVEVVGGKTGTTTPAGYCLVIFAKNKKNERLISVVLGGHSREQLYALHSQMLKEFGNEAK